MSPTIMHFCVIDTDQNRIIARFCYYADAQKFLNAVIDSRPNLAVQEL